MPTRIRATAPFSNDRYLSHLDENRVRRGQEVEVEDRYAERVVKKGIAEVAASDVETSGEWALGEHAASGYYYARYEGERVDEEDGGYMTVGRGEEDAQAEIDRRNEEGLTPADC
jgi:hypothetical protein